MDKILRNNKVYSLYNYRTEDEFERKIIEKSNFIFGENSIYIDIKKRIGNKILSIPDGYLIDYSFNNSPTLFIIENELSNHDPYRHIGSQMLRFAISYDESRYELKEILKRSLSTTYKKKTKEALLNSKFSNIDELLDYVVYKKKISAIVIIDDLSEELGDVLSQLTMNTDVITFKTYKHSREEIHLFEPFNQELIEISESKSYKKTNYDEIDTIVVPARKDGFERVFLGANCWYAIKMSASVIDKIKYIASYQVSPISAITHIAEVDRIEKYETKNMHPTDEWKHSRFNNKYIVYFKGKAKKIKNLKLLKANAPQGPRYTSSKKLKMAKTFQQAF